MLSLLKMFRIKTYIEKKSQFCVPLYSKTVKKEVKADDSSLCKNELK